METTKDSKPTIQPMSDGVIKGAMQPEVCKKELDSAIVYFVIMYEQPIN